MNRSGHAVVVALTFAGVLILTGEIQGAKRLRGGDTYSSKTKLFEVTVPRGCSPFLSPYDVQEGNRKGEEFYEEVLFYMKDMGEVYHVGVRRLSPELRAKVGHADGPLEPPKLAWLGVFLHFGPREQTTGEWKPVAAFEEVITKHGPGVLSVNTVEGGRLLSTMTVENGKLVPARSTPATVVVLMVQKGDHLIYVTGQADGSDMIGTSAESDCVRQRLRGTIDTLVLARPLT